MYYTGIDPFTGKEVHVAKHLRDRKLQRALMQFFKPENYFQVRRALEQAGRQDLIGSGCDCLIPARPPREAIDARRRAAVGESGSYVHQIQTTDKSGKRKSRNRPGTGYRPARRSASAATAEKRVGKNSPKASKSKKKRSRRNRPR